MSYESIVDQDNVLAPAPKMNGLGLAGFILALVGWVVVIIWIITNILVGVMGLATGGMGLCCGCITGPVGLLSPLLWLVGGILNIAGWSQVRNSPTLYTPSSKSLTIIGLVLNGLGILLALCSILAMIILPAGVTLPFLVPMPTY